MKNKKLSGSYYTPTIIANFLIDYLSDKLKNHQEISMLEPSAGDGVFVRTIYNHETISKRIKKVVAVEQSKAELNKVVKRVTQKSFLPIHDDFLKYQVKNNEKFSLVIGNPPYIKKSLLKLNQIKACRLIHKKVKLANNSIKNIWTAFLVRCIEFTDTEGVLAFVLPSEFLQVKFATELREFILAEFERVEIFTFNELLFKDCKGQDTLLLIAERKSEQKGVYYCNINKLSDLKDKKFTLAKNVKIKESKWTHHHLETDEIELLEKLKQQIKTINNYCNSRAGIVTAANDFFIVDTNIVEQYSLRNFVIPIIQKGAFVNGSVDLSKKDFQLLIDQSKPTYLIAINKNSIIKKNAKLLDYLKIGIENNIDKRYKTLLRNNWYEVPNVGVAPAAFFFKRCNEYPKLVRNSANVLSTDSAYTISMKEDYKVENLIYSFYNSLTLAFGELYGRYYGGGVLELTPNEFKILPVPYLKIIPTNFKSYVAKFKSKSSIKDICMQNDIAILRAIDSKIDNDSIKKVYKIREKLYLRRIKTN